MEQHKIDRINTLAKKSKIEGLTPSEKEEQNILRKEYIKLFRTNLIHTLDQVSVEKDGEIIHMKDVRTQRNIKADQS